MKVNLISFQEKAVKELRMDIADALDSYRRREKTQVVSLQAPTGERVIIVMGAIYVIKSRVSGTLNKYISCIA